MTKHSHNFQIKSKYSVPSH